MALLAREIFGSLRRLLHRLGIALDSFRIRVEAALDGSKVSGQIFVGDMLLEYASPRSQVYRAESPTGVGVLSKVSYIEPRNMIGGLPPENGCDKDHDGDELRVDFTANYAFYTAALLRWENFISQVLSQLLNSFYTCVKTTWLQKIPLSTRNPASCDCKAGYLFRRWNLTNPRSWQFNVEASTFFAIYFSMNFTFMEFGNLFCNRQLQPRVTNIAIIGLIKWEEYLR